MLFRSRALPLALSALLALSSCLPCYTLAYADEGAEVIADGRQDHRGTGRGDELEEGSAQPAPYNEAGEGAAAGEAEAEDIWEVPSGSSPDSCSPADSGLDGASEDAYSSSGRDFESPVSESLIYQGSFFSDDGIMPLAGFGGALGGGFGGAFSGGSGLGKSANTTDAVDSFTSAWGWGYGSSVVHLYSNSPAGWLKSLKDKTDYISEQLKAIDGDVVGALNYIQSQLRSLSDGNQSRANAVVGLLQNQWGYWVGNAYVVKANSPAERLAALLDITNYLSAQLKAVGGTVSYISEQIKSVASLMPQGSTVVYISDQIKALGGYLVANGNLVSSGFDHVQSRFDKIDYISEQIKSIASLMPLGSDVSYMREQLKSIGGYLVANGNLVSKGFADILDKMDGIQIDVSLPAITVDMSGIELRLDDIKGLLLAAGAVENTKDLLAAIIGDLDDLASAALLGEVQAVAQDAFPFCIPFVVKQLLGLVESDPAPPEFDFVIGGEVMHVDFAFAQGFVDILGWACRFLLVFGLVVSSRRFIYTGAVS